MPFLPRMTRTGLQRGVGPVSVLVVDDDPDDLAIARLRLLRAPEVDEVLT